MNDKPTTWQSLLKGIDAQFPGASTSPSFEPAPKGGARWIAGRFAARVWRVDEKWYFELSAKDFATTHSAATLAAAVDGVRAQMQAKLQLAADAVRELQDAVQAIGKQG